MDKEFKLMYYGKQIASISYPADEDRDIAETLRELTEYLVRYLDSKEVMADDRQRETSTD